MRHSYNHLIVYRGHKRNRGRCWWCWTRRKHRIHRWEAANDVSRVAQDGDQKELRKATTEIGALFKEKFGRIRRAEREVGDDNEMVCQSQSSFIIGTFSSSTQVYMFPLCMLPFTEKTSTASVYWITFTRWSCAHLSSVAVLHILCKQHGFPRLGKYLNFSHVDVTNQYTMDRISSVEFQQWPPIHLQKHKRTNVSILTHPPYYILYKYIHFLCIGHDLYIVIGTYYKSLCFPTFTFMGF
jgi:hypothetical protein